MGLGREQEVEIFRPPVFKPGDKVVSLKHIRNDGTVRGRDIGEIIVKKGDVGYVRDIGTFLQQFFIYAVDWVERGTVVGMRAKELKRWEQPAEAAKEEAG
ncbi:MAG: nitrogen fixation protein NifZ [Hyphomicrobiaceae bacterium]|nr:nitrogen fixation protein NifZ [Hyphomicrobiaceae bacterium]